MLCTQSIPNQALAVLETDDLRQFTPVGVEQLAEFEHDFGSAREWRRSPAFGSLFGDRDGVVDLLQACQINFGLNLTRGGIPDIGAASRGRRKECPSNPVVNSFRGLGVGGLRFFGGDGHALLLIGWLEWD